MSWYGKYDDEPTLEQKIARMVKKQIEKEKKDDDFSMKTMWAGEDDDEPIRKES